MRWACYPADGGGSEDADTNLNISYPGKPRCITPTFCSLNYICALSFKELNETHLYIYLYPMSLTSMTGSCRSLCYRTPVEVE